jgi:hypothetical protein
MNVSPKRMVEHLLENKFRPSRMDYALDLYDAPVTISDIYDQLKDGRISCPSKNVTLIQSGNGLYEGKTIYVGSRQSERYLRIYDKGVEQNSAVSGQWIRIELEVKGKRVHDGFEAIKRSSVEGASAAQLLGYITTQQQWFTDAVAGHYAVPASIISRPITNRRRWLLGQVATAIKNEMMEDDQFWTVLASVVSAPEPQDLWYNWETGQIEKRGSKS